MIKAQIAPAILMTILFTVATGLIFPVVIWGLGQVMFSNQANGSILVKGDAQVGSEIIGQSFSARKYFHPRPSAAGAGYDPLGSSGTNLGPTSKKLFEGLPDDPSTKDTDESYSGIGALAKSYRDENGVAATELIPADAVTRSASGLDPHISPRNAELQAGRVASERGMKKKDVLAQIAKSTEPRFIGIFGEPRVNVLKLNLVLDAGESQPSAIDRNR